MDRQTHYFSIFMVFFDRVRYQYSCCYIHHVVDAICDCTDEAKTNPTHLNVVTVLCCSSPRWFVHIFLYYHNPGTAFGFCPAVSNSTYFPQLV